MEKDVKKTIFQFVGIVALIALIMGVLLLVTKEKTVTDAIKFKNEYEALNDTVRKSDGETYGAIKIPEDNPIKYISAKEAVEVIDSDEAIMYIGAPWCPWCRNAVLVLFEVAKKYDIDTIYYVELDDIKSNYEVQNGTLIKTKAGTKDYYDLLDKLSDRLSDYTITSDGKKYETGEKRIFMPYVLAIHDGKVVKDKVGTVKLDENQTKYEALSEEQHEELTEDYEELFEAALEGIEPDCDDEVCE